MRRGVDARPGKNGDGGGAATWLEMLLQITRDYPGLPDPRTLTIPEIVCFYNGVRDELKRHTRPREGAPPRPRG